MTEIKTHRGSCHCGLVQFEADLDATKATMCNCTLCTKLGMKTTIVKPEALRVLSDESKHGRVQQAIGYRVFCPNCGTHCYGRGHLSELGGDFASINQNALDDIDPFTTSLLHWDGRHDNWAAGPREQPWPIPVESRRASKLARQP